MAKSLFVLALVLITSSLIECNYNGETIEPESNEDDEATSTTESTDVDMDSRLVVDLMVIMTECNETFRIEMAYLEALNISGSFPDETDNTPKCYLRCVLQRSDVMDSEGALNATRAAVLLTAMRGGGDLEDMEKVTTACAERPENCKCEKSYKYLKCVMEKEIEKYTSTS